MSRFILTLALVFLGCPILGYAQQASVSEVNPPVGINLAGIAYWSTELPFVDLFKMSQPLISQK